MSRKKKFTIGFVCLCLILLIPLCLNVSISGDPLTAGGAVCVSFDKQDMLRADKVIISFQGEVYTITDPGFIKSFCKETLAGTHIDYCCSTQNDGWVEIYRGNRLLRRMRYIANHDAFVYEADAAHWVFFGAEGHAFLSGEMSEKLHEIIGR